MNLAQSFAPAGFWLALTAMPVLANDGFGGIAATGLTFSETEAVAMEEEDLFIGIDRIAVDYVFRNLTDKDVTGEVIFPLPPIPVESDYDWNLPEDRDRENLVNFTAKVDGAEVQVGIDRIAVIAPAWEEGRPLSEQYDTPGKDVTADLQRLGIPVTLNGEKVEAALLALDEVDREEAIRLGLAQFSFYDGQEDITPLFSIVLRYHWTQIFPAQKTVRISHEYENRPPGGLFSWSEPPADYEKPLVDQYCIDAGTSKAILKALERPSADGEILSGGYVYYLDYVLRTANSWAGPIGKFRLTIDKGAPQNVISLCADGIRKTGATTFVMEKTDYVPDRDLGIMLVTPAGN